MCRKIGVSERRVEYNIVLNIVCVQSSSVCRSSTERLGSILSVCLCVRGPSSTPTLGARN